MTTNAITIAPGAQYFPRTIQPGEQQQLVARCLEMGAADAGFYTPIVRGGKPMSVKMRCLGRHWNALTYRYEDVRSDIDRRPVPPLPQEFAALAVRIARDAGFAIAPDICIV